MSKKLSDILLSVETSDFEDDMWAFAVDKYFHLETKYGTSSMLDKKFDEALNDRFYKVKRNQSILEGMNVEYMYDEDDSDDEIDILIEEMMAMINDESEEIDEGFKDGAVALIDKAKGLGDDVINKVKGGVDKGNRTVIEKWNKVKQTWTRMLKTLKEWMVAAKLSTKELMTILTNEGFVKVFKVTMTKLFKGLQKLLDVWANTADKVQGFLFNGLKRSKIGHGLDEISAFLDKKLNVENDKRWKKYARVALGLAVVWITYYMWTKMFFIGDWRYDFDYSNALGTITGATNFATVLGADWIPTLAWFVSGLVSNTFNLMVPCPPNCSWFGEWNLVAAGFVTAYIVSTNGSLKDIKDSTIGTKIRLWLKTIPRKSIRTPYKSPQAKLLLKKGRLLKPN